MMNQEIKYPFEIVSVFLKSFSFNRIGVIPENRKASVISKFKIIENEFPKLQINLLFETEDPAPVSFKIEGIGLFRYVGKQKKYDKELNKDFVVDKGLHILWVYLDRVTRMFTNEMGVEPLQGQIPISFSLAREKLKKAISNK